MGYIVRRLNAVPSTAPWLAVRLSYGMNGILLPMRNLPSLINYMRWSFFCQAFLVAHRPWHTRGCRLSQGIPVIFRQCPVGECSYGRPTRAVPYAMAPSEKNPKSFSFASTYNRCFVVQRTYSKPADKPAASGEALSI